MASTISDTKSAAFYREWFMGRQTVNPRDYGIDLDKDDFTDRMVELFAVKYRDHWTVDELLLHPREAALFCDDARRSIMGFDVPDDVILRVILGRRKNPTA
jgi:zona occludens toxin (predicted ATPase)